MKSKVIRCWFMIAAVSITEASSYALSRNVSAVTYNVMQSSAYIGQLFATQILYCPIASLGEERDCYYTGPTSFIMPSSLAMNPAGHVLYVVDHIYQSISSCSINAISGQLINCKEIDHPFEEPSGIAVDPQGYYVYVTHGLGLSVCSLKDEGHFENCHALQVSMMKPSAIALNASGTKAYILAAQNNNIWSCTVNHKTGSLVACSALDTKDATNSSEKRPLAHNIYSTIRNLNDEYFVTSCSIDESGDLTYVNQYPDGSAFRCLIDQNTADFKKCFQGGDPLAYGPPSNIIINAKNTRIYIISAGQVKLTCSINPSGALTRCTSIYQVMDIPWRDMAP